jgi:hypothetical protein
MNKKLANIHNLLMLAYMLLIATAAILLSLDGAQSTALLFSAVLLPFAVLHFLLARGVSSGQNWARRVSQVIAVPILFIFPVGTFVGGSMLMCAGSMWESTRPLD